MTQFNEIKVLKTLFNLSEVNFNLISKNYNRRQ